MNLKEQFKQQQQAYLKAPYPSASQRKDALRQLRRQLQRYQEALAQAMSEDFGWRAHSECLMFDVLAPVLEINHCIRHVGRWMRPSRRSTELLFLTNRIAVHYQPKGVVGVIVPWNFPVYLAVGPLAAALAAGNRVMIKMPEITPRTNAVLRTLLGEVFATDQVVVVDENLPNPNDFTALPFNHIVFTGSSAVGRIVMQTAAQNLTPVTLELGGKSPALVSKTCDVSAAASSIAHGKLVNAGQICVSPDYALVPKAALPEFIDELQKAFTALYSGEGAQSVDFTSIVNENHFERLQGLLKDAQDKGAQIISCGTIGADRKMPLQIVTQVSNDMRVMQEELFGPILPIQTYDTIDEAIAYINQGLRPLALYYFGHDANERDRVLKQTHSGGVTVNGCAWHVINHDAPFGGVGNSGMGTYHGVEGFKELSHAKTVFKRHRWFPIGLFYPPYGNIVQKLSLKFYLGKADPNV